MKRWGIILVGMIVIAGSVAALGQGSEEDELKRIMNNICGADECEGVVWEEPQDFEEFFEEGSFGEEAEYSGDSLLFWPSGEEWGDCHHESESSPTIHCVASQSYSGIAVGLATWVTDDDGKEVIIMCYLYYGAYVLGGWATIPGYTILDVDGSGSGDYIGIIKDAYNYSTYCDFEDFPNYFDGDTDINGNSGTDTVSGSQYADTLHGEEVYGFDGDDSIYLGTSDHGSGNGGRGSDYITGSSYADSYYGDDPSDTTGGYDTIYGADGNDFIAGVFRGDTLYGGNDNDSLEGGEFTDTLWGGAGNDSLSGGDGDDSLYGEDDTDTCNGGNGTADYCEAWPGCDSRSRCEL